jgi:hypothetical protein
MKTTGREELAKVLARCRRLRALGRISGPDASFIESHLLEADARIISMAETNEHGEEE